MSLQSLRQLRTPLLVLTALLPPATRAAEPASGAPAKVENAVKETELATVTLTPQAEQRLGVKTEAIERKSMRVMRQFSGEVIMPMMASGENAPNFVTLSTATPAELFKLADLQALADGEVAKTKVLHDAAGTTLERAQKLRGAQAGSERSVDDAEVAVAVAGQTLETARERRALLGPSIAKSLSGGKLWVRVPVYVGALPRLETDAPAQLIGLDAQAAPDELIAQPVQAPPSASALTATVDLFYEVKAAAGQFRPGQKVGLSLPLRGEDERLVAPWAAVVHDIHGGAWVYENVAPHVFARRRVQVERVAGREAILASGPKPGSMVVTDGAAEIFGTEFGTGK